MTDKKITVVINNVTVQEIQAIMEFIQEYRIQHKGIEVKNTHDI